MSTEKMIVYSVILMLAFTLNVYTQENKARPASLSDITMAPTPAVKYDITLPDSLKTGYEQRSFLHMINTAYAAPSDISEDKDYLRREWKEFLGMDVFMPYFKAQEVEDWVKEKAHINFFKIRGEPKLRKNQIQYKFQVKF